MKNLFIMGMLTLVTAPAFAQWTPGSGCDYTGNSKIGIGMSSCPTYNFIVNPPSTSQGVQAIFGGTSLVGYPFFTAGGTGSVLEVQAPGGASYSLCANNNGTSNDNMWIGCAGSYFMSFFSRNSSDKLLEFIMGGTRTMTLWPSGQVGIGTQANALGTDTKLAVAGLITCNEMKVIASGSPWPDYVFAKDFKRMSLKEVEHYITDNKHLPQLPAAEAIEKDGFKVGETQAQILQAVEELYLHVIDLKKENDELKKQIGELKHK